MLSGTDGRALQRAERVDHSQLRRACGRAACFPSRSPGVFIGRRWTHCKMVTRTAVGPLSTQTLLPQAISTVTGRATMALAVSLTAAAIAPPQSSNPFWLDGCGFRNRAKVAIPGALQLWTPPWQHHPQIQDPISNHERHEQSRDCHGRKQDGPGGGAAQQIIAKIAAKTYHGIIPLASQSAAALHCATMTTKSSYGGSNSRCNLPKDASGLRLPQHGAQPTMSRTAPRTNVHPRYDTSARPPPADQTTLRKLAPRAMKPTTQTHHTIYETHHMNHIAGPMGEGSKCRVLDSGSRLYALTWLGAENPSASVADCWMCILAKS
jgi:hypothetical protein